MTIAWIATAIAAFAAGVTWERVERAMIDRATRVDIADGCAAEYHELGVHSPVVPIQREGR